MNINLNSHLQNYSCETKLNRGVNVSYHGSAITSKHYRESEHRMVFVTDIISYSSS